MNKLWTFDTEDDSRGNVKIINFFDGVEHQTFWHRDITKKCSQREKSRLLQRKALQFLENIEGHQHTFWAVNLQYDLNNLFGEHLYLPKINYVGSRTISASILGTGIRFHDTMNQWKIGVAEMGKMIGLPKMKTDDFDNPIYCQRDTEIPYLFIKRTTDFYEKIGCKLKATIGSTALNFFESKFYTKQKRRILTKSEIEFLHQGYYGGRTEIFFNEPITGKIWYHDFNSLYPAVSLNKFPQIRRDAIHFTKEIDLNHEGAADVTVRTNRNFHIPYLPARSDSGGLIFPNGVFRGVYTYFELREALKIGYTIEKVHKALEFTAGTFFPFRDFMLYLFNLRKNTTDPIESRNLKDLMNNLYGKWGQGNEHEELIPHGGKIKENRLIMGPLMLEKIEDEYPTHTNKIWAMYTTAYGRHKEYEALIQVEKSGAKLIACDTDSVLYEHTHSIFEDSKELGGLKLEPPLQDGKPIFFPDGTQKLYHDYAHFKLPKLYRLDNDYKAKGIPKKINGEKSKNQEEFFNEGRTTFRKPLKLRETLRRNLSKKRKRPLRPNFWVEVEKVSNKSYDKRKVLRSGDTEPLTIRKRRKYANRRKQSDIQKKAPIGFQPVDSK